MNKAKVCFSAIIFILVFASACQPQTESSPTATSFIQALPTWTPTTQPPDTPTIQPPNTPTTHPTNTPTTQPPPTPTPELPAAGPLPAVWKDLDFGLHAGNLYYPYSIAVDRAQGVLYAIGSCDAPSLYSEPVKTCISVLDLDSEQVLRRVVVDAGSYSKLKLIGETLYVVQRWTGDLIGLDAETLTVTQTVSDVVDIAGDGTGTLYALTTDGIQRLSPDPLFRPLESTFSNQPIMLMATPERIFVLGYESLRIIDTQLNPVKEINLRDYFPRVITLDEPNGRLYVGGNGLGVIEVENGQFTPLNTETGQIEYMLFDPERDELILNVYGHDWYGGQQIVVVDAQTGAFRRTLYETREGNLYELAFDPLQPRLLVLDSPDHALIPIPQEGPGGPGRRIPLGIELGEMALDLATDHLIVGDSAGRVHVLDRRSYAGVAQLDGGRLLSLDLSRRRLYTGDARLPAVRVYDLDSLSWLHEIQQAGKPRANPATGEVVVINRQAFVFDGTTGERKPPLIPDIGVPFENCPGCFYTVVREVIVDPVRGLTATITYTPWPGKPGPDESVAVDPASGRVWYALLTGGYIRQSSIDIYSDLSALQTRLYRSGGAGPMPPLRTLEGLSGPLALDVSARRLYVTRANNLFVLDSETLERLGRLKVENWMPVIRAVDEELGRLYSTEASRLIVWTRQGGAPASILPPQPFTPTGYFEWILPSPDFARDQTVLAFADQHLCRSTDGGKTWASVSDGLGMSGWALRFTALFSPAYADDHTIWVGAYAGDSVGEGIWVSTDGGNTWRDSSRGLLDLRVYRLVSSPHFASDRTLLAYANSGNGRVLYRSTDAGQTWQLVMRQASYDQPPLSQPIDVFGVGAKTTQFRLYGTDTLERSDDDGKTWRHVQVGNLPLDRLQAYAVSPFFESDHTVYLMAESALYRAVLPDEQTVLWERCLSPELRNREHYTRSLTALAVAPTGKSSYDLLIGTANGDFYRLSPDNLIWEKLTRPPTPTPAPRPAMTATPKPTLSPTPCATLPDKRLGINLDNLPPGTGCPTEPATTTMVAYQPFESGRMFWRADLRQIYVLEYNGTWRVYQDTWDESQPVDDPTLVAPELLFQPVRGFGKLWREQLGGPKARIGWATAREYGYEAVIQNFSGGIVLRGENTIYYLRNNGDWEAYDIMQ